MGRAAGKVAFISGVARGQGRQHAIRLAEEGANIIGFDLLQNDPLVEYPLASQEDLDETINLVEKAGGQIHAVQADVRDREAVKAVADAGFEKFGRIDIVLANAGIMPITGDIQYKDETFDNAIDVMLTGVYNTVRPTIEHLKTGGNGGSIIITSSTNGIVGGKANGSAGILGYAAAKHGVVGLMRVWALLLAEHQVRVNTVHPTGVSSPMILNEAFGRYVQEYPEIAANLQNPLQVNADGMLTPNDVSNTVLHLVSDEGKFVTGQTVVVDGGFTAR